MGPTPFLKNCPRCNSPLFADMDQCFDCLYDYGNPSLDYAGSGMDRAPSEGVPSEGIPLDEPVPIDAYSQEYPTFEPDAGEAPYLDGYLPCGPDAMVDEGMPHEEPVGGETAPERAIVEAAQGGPGSEPDEPIDPVGGGQDAGLFADPTDSGGEDRPVQTRRPSGDVRLGVLVHWRGMEMATALDGDRLTIGRDRANAIAIASFDVPAFAASIEPAGDGAEVRLLTEDMEATLDGASIHGTVQIGAGQEVDLYGARLSLIRLD